MDAFWTLSYALIVLLLLMVLYSYMMKPFKYWEERGIPQAPVHPVIGSLYENFTQPLHLVSQKRYQKYGRIHGYYESTKPVLLVGDPEILRDILLKDFQFLPSRREFSSGNPIIDSMVSILEGEEWKRVRTIMTPAFSTGKIKKMTSIILSAAERTSENFAQHADSGKPADCKKVFGAFTMDVIARSAFGINVDSHNDPENVFVRHARMAFTTELSLGLIMFFLCPKLMKFLGMSVIPKRVTNFFKDVTLKMVKQRRASGQKQNDFLQLLIDAADEAANCDKVSAEETQENDDAEKSINDFGHDTENKKIFQTTKINKSMSEDELVAQCILFFIAGYDTTASTLALASYLLALNTDCQETLINEIDEMLAKYQGKITYEGVQSMKFLENVIWETLRIYNPAIFLERRTAQEYKLKSMNLTIPKGMLISVPIYAIHHDPEFYEDPEKFDPNRFTKEEKDRRNPYTYIPFGAGPRNCIGMRFALIEVKLCLTVFFSKFRLKTCSETKVPLQFKEGGTGLLQPHGIILAVEKRTDTAEF